MVFAVAIFASISLASTKSIAAGQTKTITTTQECSIWSKPDTSEGNRVKKIPAGWNVTIYPTVVQSTKGDGKTFYQTVKGCYILCRCCDGNETPSTTIISTSHTPTTGEKNAVTKAKSYIKYSAFSHDGLVEQLEYNKYTHEEAVYGADNCGANWDEQATKKAKSYIKYTAFSLDGLVEQLEYNKFTSKQAQYGALTCGADWNEQAVKKAESYLKYSSFSKEGLYNQLLYNKFTPEQAKYAVESVYK